MQQRSRQWCAASDLHHVVASTDPVYPALLNEISDPPSIIYVKGTNPDVLHSAAVAVVGSRKATSAGLSLAHRFAQQLGEVGLTIVSGLALGIDAAAHEGALAAGVPTVAVMACGLDSIYPRRHEDLAARIVASGGVLLSEFAPGTPVLPHQFIQRNRLISGLSLGTVIVEASARSGSLTTARFAAEQGRDVFAVPGSILSPNSVGCHALLRDGAQLTASVDDVVAGLGWSVRQPVLAKPRAPLSGDEGVLLEHLGYEPTAVDELVVASGWSVAKVTVLLTELQLRGYIEHQLGQGFQRVS